ncbi:MAG: hypothetical protein Q4A05_04185 [Ruminococcus sp.]|nr:hypothetical protein [Ruminococcus sp.]
MKKLISSVISLGLAACAAVPTAFAADSGYVPTAYFRANKGECISVCPDGNAVVFRSELGSSDNIIVNASVYIDDESLTCWNVHPVWKCASEYAKLENLVDPLPMSADAPNIAYAYAETNEAGEFTHIRHGTILNTDERYNTMSFTCQVTSLTERSAMKPYGEKSDSYPLTSFDINISADAPEGDIDVHFLTEHEDYADQRLIDVAMRTEEGSLVKTPVTKPLTVTVTDRKFGDVNADGKVDSNDASAVLVAYSKSSTGGEHGLSNLQFACGDSDKNGLLTSSDASNILAYYSYLSTTDEAVNFTNFLANRGK